MLEINLKSRIAIVTGSNRGIGLGVAKMLAKAGCVVAGCATGNEDDESAQNFVSVVEGQGSEAYYKKCDVTNPKEIQHFVSSVVERFNGIDVLVSNAGANVFKGVDYSSLEDWKFNTDLNLRSHWLMAKAARPSLQQSAYGGCVIVMTSNHAYSSIPGCFPYNVTKTALTGLVRAMALEWRNSIRVLGIAPGFIETEGGDKWFQSFDNPEREKQNTIDRHLVKNLGTPEDIGAFCAYLASDFASFMTGTTYLLDGGRSAIMQDE